MKLNEISDQLSPYVVYVVGVSSDHYEKYVLNAADEANATRRIESYIVGRHDNEREVADVMSLDEFLEDNPGERKNINTPHGDEIICFDYGT